MLVLKTRDNAMQMAFADAGGAVQPQTAANGTNIASDGVDRRIDRR